MQHVMFQIQYFSSFLSFLPIKQKCLCYIFTADSKTLAILIGSIHHLRAEKYPYAYLNDLHLLFSFT